MGKIRNLQYIKLVVFQVFNKSNKGEYNKKPGNGQVQTKSPNTSEESSTIDEASLSELRESSAKLSELENLLSKADDKSISKCKAFENHESTNEIW